MALIIEDGTIVADANSFTTDDELVAYAESRGVAIPFVEAERDVLQIKAMDYFASIEINLSGSRVSIDQDLTYPRKGACAKGFNVPSTGLKSIPKDIKKAQMELAMQAFASDILVSESTTNIQSIELDGVIKESYFNGGSRSVIRTDKADAYLKPYYTNRGSSNEMGRA